MHSWPSGPEWQSGIHSYSYFTKHTCAAMCTLDHHRMLSVKKDLSSNIHSFSVCLEEIRSLYRPLNFLFNKGGKINHQCVNVENELMGSPPSYSFLDTLVIKLQLQDPPQSSTLLTGTLAHYKPLMSCVKTHSYGGLNPFCANTLPIQILTQCLDWSRCCTLGTATCLCVLTSSRFRW